MVAAVLPVTTVRRMDRANRPRERVVIWANAAAGRREAPAIADRIEHVARQIGHDVEVVADEHVDAAVELARRAIERSIHRLIVVGGDGTIHHAVQVVAGTDTVLGIVPAGSGNDFGAALGLPTDRAAAIDAAFGDPAPVDAIRVGDRWAATVVTAGLSVAVTVRAQQLSWIPGGAKYTAAALLEIPRLRRYPMELIVDGERHDIAPNLLAVANTSRFGGGMLIAPDAEHDDGLLDVVTLGPTNRRTMLRLLPSAGRGGHIGHRAVTVRRGRRIEIVSAHPHRIDGDGEALTTTPTVIESVRGALLVAGVTPRRRPSPDV